MNRTFASLLAIALAAGALAQSGAVSDRAYQTMTFESDSIDTTTIYPQIDETFLLRPLRPENPLVRKGTNTWTSPPNVPLGGIRNQPRGKTMRYFPGPGYTGLVPPDPDFAVGPTHIVCVVNSRIGFYLKTTGAQQFLQNSTTFYTGLGAGTFQFDPKVIYDRVHQRFVMIFLEEDDASQTSKVLLAISDNSDPNGTWYKYRLESEWNGAYWLDYPGLGYNKDAIVVNGNLFGYAGGVGGVHYLVIPTANILSGGAAVVKYIRSDSATAFSVQVAEMIDPAIDRVYGVMDWNVGLFKTLSINNVTSATPTVTYSATIPVTAFAYPTANIQAGATTLDSFDGRVFNAVFRGGRLLTAHTIWPTPGKVRWYEFNMSNWPVAGSPTVFQQGNLSNASFHYHMAALNKNAAGDVSAIFTKSSAATVADMMRASRLVGDASGTMGTPVLLEASVGTASGMFGRWGDYAGVDVDPVDDYTFWGYHLTMASTGNWRTSFFSWVVTAPPMDITPATLNLGTGSVLSGTVADLATSNDVKLVARPGAVLISSQFPLAMRVGATSPDLSPTSIQVTIESNCEVAASEKIEILNADGSYSLLDNSAAAVGTDGTKTFTITTTPSLYVHQTTGAVGLRISYKNIGEPSVFPWQSRIDWVRWRIVP